MLSDIDWVLGRPVAEIVKDPGRMAIAGEAVTQNSASALVVSRQFLPLRFISPGLIELLEAHFARRVYALIEMGIGNVGSSANPASTQGPARSLTRQSS